MQKQESQILLASDHLAIIFPYDAEQVKAVKRIPNAKWDAVARTWRAPLSSIPEAKEFGKRYNFWVDPQVAGLAIPKRPTAARIDVHNDTVRIRFPYDEVKIAAVRQIPGAKWDSDSLHWTAPLESVSEIVDWGEDYRIPIADEVRTLIGTTNSKRSGLLALSSLTELRNPIDTSVLEGELFPFQHVALRYALETRRCFIADTMGLGKTIVSLAAIEIGAGGPAVVICPPTLVLNWVSEINRWLPHRKVATLSGMAKKAYTSGVTSSKVNSIQAEADWGQYLFHSDKQWVDVTPKTAPEETAATLSTADFIVLGYSTVSAWQPVLSKYATSLICDESQYIKNGKAKRTKATVKLAAGLPSDGMVLCLTGTPVLNRPAELAFQLKALGHLDTFGGEWGFYKRYCAAFKDKWGQWHLEGSSHREELNERLRSICYVRRLKEDVLGDLAPVRHQVVPVKGDPKAMREYAKAEADIAEYMAKRAAEIAKELGENPRSAAVIARIKAESAEHIVRLSALRRLAAKAKAPAIQEMVQAHVDEGSKVVIAAHHREIVTGLADLYGGFKIQGGMKVEEVERLKAQFQEEDAETVPVMVLSIQAAKTGHTLTAAQDIIIAELPWTPADADQVIARLHRIGQTGSVMATWVLTDDTIDHDVYAMLEQKRRVVDAVTDGGDYDLPDDVVGSLLASFAMAGLEAS